MGRPIDADKLKADLEKAISKNEDMDCLDFLRAASVIDAQPTAYDLDKVVDQLNDNFRVVRTDEDLEWNRAMDEAITIVKGGGVDAKTDF